MRKACRSGRNRHDSDEVGWIRSQNRLQPSSVQVADRPLGAGAGQHRRFARFTAKWRAGKAIPVATRDDRTGPNVTDTVPVDHVNQRHRRVMSSVPVIEDDAVTGKTLKRV